MDAMCRKSQGEKMVKITQRSGKRSCSSIKDERMNTMQPKKQPSVGSVKENQGRKSVKSSATSIRRSSARLKSQKNTKTPDKPFMGDSAYDGDEELSPSTSQSDENDPYSVATMEDVPVVPRGRRKRPEKQPIPADQKAKAKKRTSNAGCLISSTPNQVIQPFKRRSTRSSSRLSSTPEVTPILPVNSDDIASQDHSFDTPQIYHLAHKQSSANLPTSPSLQSSSQADSGIALSPPAKRARFQSNQPRHRSAAVLGKKFMNKRNIFNPDSKAKESDSEAKENVDNSCFGFNNFRSCSNDRGGDFPISEVYRSSQAVTSDSSPTSPSQDSEMCGNSQQWPSPGLFSDDMISADSESMTLNKSSAKSYKPSKTKKLKHKKLVSKFEAWAKETNMEIEDIEKFDLNIE